MIKFMKTLSLHAAYPLNRFMSRFFVVFSLALSFFNTTLTFTLNFVISFYTDAMKSLRSLNCILIDEVVVLVSR